MNTDIVLAHTSRGDFTALQLRDLEVSLLPDQSFLVMVNNKPITVFIESSSDDLRNFTVRVGREKVEVGLVREIDQLVQSMGFNKSVRLWVETLRAPMPGMVKQVLVQEGEEVSAGQNLIVLEAMKMENVIRSPQAGKIKKIEVKPSQTVDKGQALVLFLDLA